MYIYAHVYEKNEILLLSFFSQLLSLYLYMLKIKKKD